MCHSLTDPEQSLAIIQIRKGKSASSLKMLLLMNLAWWKIRLARFSKDSFLRFFVAFSRHQESTLLGTVFGFSSSRLLTALAKAFFLE